MWVKCTVPDSRFFSLFSSASSCFVNSPTDHNSQQILTYDGSKDVVWRKDVPFGGPKVEINF